MLFVVHRENIAKKSLNSFKKIMPNKSFGLYTGGKFEIKDYIFATIQTISQEKHLNNFSFDYFDYIIIDEVHHAGAISYIKIINYFKPKFLLGMTATPERTDGFNIYELFDYNIVHEISLNEALDAKMLTPFLYFGVADITVDGYLIDEKSNFKQLISTNRINHIIETSNFYGFSGDTLNSLIFISSIKEGIELEKMLLILVL